MEKAQIGYQALTIISPQIIDGEAKDQDRALWFKKLQIAALSDGVTTSPFSREAAEVVTSMAPMLFQGNLKERLAALADVLIARRLQVQDTELKLPPGASVAMQELLREAAKDHLANAFQATLVACAFTITDDSLLVIGMRCGDSVLIVFSPDGEDIFLSQLAIHDTTSNNDRRRMRFGPGDSLLVEVVGNASRFKGSLDKVGIRPRHAKKWVVCIPIDQCNSVSNGFTHPKYWLKYKEPLFVPLYLLGQKTVHRQKRYEELSFSQVVRRINSSTFQAKGAVTSVLPDHVASGWEKIEESFPIGSHVVLASDGFYSAFSSLSDLWSWLIKNEQNLRNAEEKEQVLTDLHKTLESRTNDDDISFVWVYPSQA